MFFKENPFWKTQICRYWRLWRDGKGVPCKHGRGCFFAHGEKDLQKLDPYYYKTQLCEYWNQEVEILNNAKDRKKLKIFLK